MDELKQRGGRSYCFLAYAVGTLLTLVLLEALFRRLFFLADA
jgi:hypothetical protein